MLLVILFFHFQFMNLEKVISEFFKMCSNVWKLGAGFVITNSTDYSNVVDPDLIRTQSKEYFCFLFKGYCLSLTGSERHSPPPGATDEDGGREWSLAPPVYLTQCFIL